jgi:Domain of unknown function (DUF1906)
MNRRDFLAGAGSAIAASTVPAAAYAASGCDIDTATRIRIVDSSKDISEVATRLAGAGVKTVIRFYSRTTHLDMGKYQNTVLTHDELKAIEEAKLSVATVFQYFSRHAGFHTKNKAVYDIPQAFDAAEKMKQPEGSTLYFGADFPLRPDDEAVVTNYFEYALNEMAKRKLKWRVGIYGCGKACEMLKEKGWDVDCWIAASVSFWRTAEFFNSGEWKLFQTKTDLPTLGGIAAEVDTDILNPKFSSFGQWRTDGADVSEPQEISAKILEHRKFIQTEKLQVFAQPSEGSPIKLEPGDRERALRCRPVRMLCRQGDFAGVSFNESERLVGYCRVKDLGDQIPHWKQDWER